MDLEKVVKKFLAWKKAKFGYNQLIMKG